MEVGLMYRNRVMGLLPFIAMFLLLVSVNGVLAANTVSDMDLDPATLEALIKKGEIVIVDENPDGSLNLVTSGVLVNAPREKVWDVIVDYDRYHEFVPYCKKLTVKNKVANIWTINYDLEFKFSILKFGVNYTLRTVQEKPGKISWTWKGGDLRNTKGGWELIPIDDGKRTLAFYSALSDFAESSIVMRYVIKHEPRVRLAAMVAVSSIFARAIKERTESLAQVEKKSQNQNNSR